MVSDARLLMQDTRRMVFRPVHHGPARFGFTMIELVVVVLVLGIVSASVVPAFTSLSSARAAAAAEHVRSTLRMARASATLTGQPTGVAVDLDASSLSLVWIAPGASAPSAKIDALGVAYQPVSLNVEFPGVSLGAMTGFDGSSGGGVLWFGADGLPERRDSAGVLAGTATNDGVISLSSGESITLSAETGLEP